MQKIVIINYGSQYTRDIKARLRELGYDAQVIEPDDDPGDPAGIILSGSPASVLKPGAPQLSEQLINLILHKDTPTLAICYGIQIIAKSAANGRYSPVEKGYGGEYGYADLKISHHLGVLTGLKDKEQVWMSHGDFVELLPPDFHLVGTTEICRLAAIMHITKPILGLQFHPEVHDTPCGKKILQNFLDICGVEPNWDKKKAFAEITSETIARIGNRHIFAAISTGNDSGVLAWLLRKIVPKDRLHFLYIRGTGPDEDLDKVNLLGGAFTIVDARRQIFRALKGLVDPEAKRRAFSQVYRKIIEKWLSDIIKSLSIKREDCIIAQGTLWPDIVESQAQVAGSRVDKIKSHHNIGVFEDLRRMGNILEPFADLFKEELREFGRQLDVPERIITQHPWPGPGYIVRFLGYDSDAMPQDEQYVQAVLAEIELQTMCADLGYSASVLPIRGTGVQGDERSYCYTAALMGPYKRTPLLHLARAIPNKFKGKISRVVYVVAPEDTTSLVALGFKKDYYRPKTRGILAIANEKILIPRLRLADLYGQTSQAFAVMAPLSFDAKGYTAIIRAVKTKDFMTASPFWLPEPFLRQTSEEIMAKIPEIELILYDLTSKPPGTIEWE